MIGRLTIALNIVTGKVRIIPAKEYDHNIHMNLYDIEWFHSSEEARKFLFGVVEDITYFEKLDSDVQKRIKEAYFLYKFEGCLNYYPTHLAESS